MRLMGLLLLSLSLSCCSSDKVAEPTTPSSRVWLELEKLDRRDDSPHFYEKTYYMLFERGVLIRVSQSGYGRTAESISFVPGKFEILTDKDGRKKISPK